MAEQALYSQLETYNKTITNKYRANWGSLLNYLDNSDGNELHRIAERQESQQAQPTTQQKKQVITRSSRS